MKRNLLKYLISGIFIVLAGGATCQRFDFKITADQEYSFAFTEATKNFLFGNYVQAISLYKECLRLKPQSGAAHYQLAKVYLNAGNIGLAREHAKKANEFTKDNKWYLQQLGDIYQIEEKYDSAIYIYHELLSLDKDNINLMYGIASLYEKTGKPDQALSLLDEIDNRVGFSKEVSFTRYRIYENQGMHKEALAALKIANNLSSDDYSIAGMIAEFYRRHQMPDSAALYYREIFPKYRNDINVVFSYADFLLETGKVDSARVLLLDVMNDPELSNVAKSGYFVNLLRDDKNFMNNVPVIDTVTKSFLKGQEKDIRAWSVYAEVFLRLRKFPEASRALVKIVEMDGSNYPVLEQLVYTMNLIGKADSAIYYADRALRIYNDKPLLYLFRGSANYQLKNYEDAISDLNYGLTLTSNDQFKLDFYSLLAEAYQAIKRFDDSEGAFNKALAIDGDNIAVKNNYAYYLSLREKNLKLAHKMSLSTIKEEPKNSTFLDTYAWVLFKMGKTKKAKKYILAAMEHGGRDNGEILSHCADIHIKLGEYDAAIEFLDRIAGMSDKEEALKAQNRIDEINKMLNKKASR